MPPTFKSKKVKSPPRPVPSYYSVLRRPGLMMSGKRKSLMASTAQVDMLTRVHKILYKEEDGGTAAAGDGKPKKAASRIKVAVRVRPLSEKEDSNNARAIVHVAGPSMVVFDPPVPTQDFFYHNKKQKDVTAHKHKDLKFAFDHVYDEKAENATIFQDIMKPLITTLMEGFNCSVFAYGATGSGKTFTMLGSDDNPGLTFLTVNELYEQLGQIEDTHEYELVISYLEVYNEKVRDLLNPSEEDLQIREVGNGIDIVNLSYHRPKDVFDVLSMLQRGNSQRSQHPTDHNAESSRSHAVLQVYLKLRQKHVDMQTNVKTAKLVMVDLAGSEKGSATGCSGQRFREGASINKSLLALSTCINAMAKGMKFAAFRDSKLTRILKDSLTGKSKTVMIANVSPAHTTLEDSLNTLRYADTAKKITCKAKQNIMTAKTCLSHYTRVVEEMAERIELLLKERLERDELHRLRAQNMELRANLEMIEIELIQKEDELQKKERKLVAWEKTILQHERELKTRSGKKSPRSSTGNQIAGVRIPSVKDIKNLPGHVFKMKKAGQVIGIRKAQMEDELDAMKIDQIKLTNFKMLYYLTSDPQYEKAVTRIERNITSIMENSDSNMTGASAAAFVRYTDLTAWNSHVVESQEPQEYRISSIGLFHLHKNLTVVTELRCRLMLLTQQRYALIVKFEERERILAEAAKLIVSQRNLLRHYNHEAKSIKADYDNFVASYCERKLRFSVNSPAVKPATPPSACTSTRSSAVTSFISTPDERQRMISGLDDPVWDQLMMDAESDDKLKNLLATTNEMAVRPVGLEEEPSFAELQEQVSELANEIVLALTGSESSHKTRVRVVPLQETSDDGREEVLQNPYDFIDDKVKSPRSAYSPPYRPVSFSPEISSGENDEEEMEKLTPKDFKQFNVSGVYYNPRTPQYSPDITDSTKSFQQPTYSVRSPCRNQNSPLDSEEPYNLSLPEYMRGRRSPAFDKCAHEQVAVANEIGIDENDFRLQVAMLESFKIAQMSKKALHLSGIPVIDDDEQDSGARFTTVDHANRRPSSTATSTVVSGQDLDDDVPVENYTPRGSADGYENPYGGIGESSDSIMVTDLSKKPSTPVTPSARVSLSKTSTTSSPLSTNQMVNLQPKTCDYLGNKEYSLSTTNYNPPPLSLMIAQHKAYSQATASESSLPMIPNVTIGNPTTSQLDATFVKDAEVGIVSKVSSGILVPNVTVTKLLNSGEPIRSKGKPVKRFIKDNYPPPLTLGDPKSAFAGRKGARPIGSFSSHSGASPPKLFRYGATGSHQKPLPSSALSGVGPQRGGAVKKTPSSTHPYSRNNSQKAQKPPRSETVTSNQAKKP